MNHKNFIIYNIRYFPRRIVCEGVFAVMHLLNGQSVGTTEGGLSKREVIGGRLEVYIFHVTQVVLCKLS